MKTNHSLLLKQHAQELRNEPTDTERHLWQYLRSSQLNGCKFRRQEVLGDYIVDFVCFEPKLIIELDGGQHAEQAVYDEERTTYLKGLGYEVMRFWNDEVLTQTKVVLEKIYKYLGK